MVQNVSANGYGSINRVGVTDNGRVVYQLNDASGKTAGRISIPQQSCDVFEKSYNDMIRTAPKMQKITEEMQNPVKMEKNKKINKWSKLIGASVGLLVSAFLTRKMKFGWQALICIPSAVAGLLGGAIAGTKITTPKEAIEFTKAMQNISKIDVQQYNG